jgi:heparan-sulfate lyase
MPPLAHAYAATRDERYARAFVELTSDWIAQHPLQIDDDPAAVKFYGFGFAWYPIQVGRRLKTLCNVFPTFIHSDSVTAEFFEVFLASLYDHATKAQNPSRPMWHNMAVFEQRGFADLAATFDEFAEANQWLDYAVRKCYEKLVGQISPDGVQREWSANYHLLVLEDAVRVLSYTEHGLFPLASGLKDAIRKMYGYVFGMATPQLEMPMFGDSSRASRELRDRSRSFLYQPLLEASELFNDSKYAALARLDQAELPAQLDYAFKDAGMYAMRSDWGPQQIYFALHCSPPAISGHDHPDNGTFELCAFGRWLMTDSGFYVYDADPRERAWHRQTRVHQTLTLNNADAGVDGRHLLWHAQKEYVVASVENASYPGLLHRRTIWFVDRSLFVLVDEAIGEARGELDLHFQLCPGEMVIDAQKKCVGTTFDDANLLVCPAAPDELSLIREEGFYSEQYGIRTSRGAFAYRHRSSAPAVFATLLLPYRGSHPPTCRIELRRQPRRDDESLELSVAAFDREWVVGRDSKLGTAWCEPRSAMRRKV